MIKSRVYEIDRRNYKVKLNANESPYDFFEFISDGPINRYPGRGEKDLLDLLSNQLAVDSNQILLENGSSGCIELILKSFLKPGDKVMGFDPSFVMYEKYTEIYHGKYIGLKTQNFVMDMDLLRKKALEEDVKIVFICNPNNPTGASVSKTDIESFAKSFSGLVVVDEAYMEYSEGSMINRLDYLDNLLVIKTFSKAYGMAGLRLGYVVGPLALTEIMGSYKSPYSVNQVAMTMAIKLLKERSLIRDQISKTLEERQWVYESLLELPIRVYPSQGNFIFFKGALTLDDYLKSQDICIRSFNNGYYRVSIGRPEENRAFIRQMLSFFYKNEKKEEVV